MQLNLTIWMLCILSPLSAFSQTRFQVKPDTVGLIRTELVIRNQTRNVYGFLFNSGSGKTDFKNTGYAVQFTAGSSGAPAAGANQYTNVKFRGRKVKVWRNGYLQPPADTNGIRFDAAPGTVTFHPVLAQNDRVYIESIISIED